MGDFVRRGIAHQAVIAVEDLDGRPRLLGEARDLRRCRRRHHQDVRDPRRAGEIRLPVDFRKRRDRLAGKAEARRLQPVERCLALGPVRIARQGAVDHPRQAGHFAHIGLAGRRRREQRQTRDVVAPGDGGGRQQGTQPETDHQHVADAGLAASAGRSPPRCSRATPARGPAPRGRRRRRRTLDSRTAAPACRALRSAVPPA